VDVNEYMKSSLALLERIATATEQLASRPPVPVGTVIQVPAEHTLESQTVGNLSRTTSSVKEKAETPPAKEEKPAADTAAPSGGAKADAAKAPKPPSLDDARKALKAYAAVEGNEAAMELLGTFNGAGSVSAVAEQGDDKLAELIKKCKGQ